MKDLNRLLDDAQTDPLEANILRLARTEGPSIESRQRILAGLGASAAVGVVTRPSSAAAKVGRAGATLKWTCAGIVAVGASVALFWLAHPAASPKRVTSTPVVPPLPSALSAAASASNVPDSPPAPPASLPKPAVAHISAQPGPSLAEEVAAIRSAKQALAAANPTQALHELQVYQTRFPRGRLAQEANIVRIEALLKSGNRAAADSAADRFLSAHPDSPYAPRVHTLIGR